MVMRIQFWREINSNGHTGRSIVRTYFAPDEVGEERALKVAKLEFSQENKVENWFDRAHGYDLEWRVDDRRREERRHEITEFWTINQKYK